MSNFVIREAKIQDIPSIVNVRRAAFTTEEVQGFTTPKPSIFYYPKKLKKEWKSGNQLEGGWSVFVVEDEGEVVGFIVTKAENGFGYIDNINVSKTQQRHGVGKALVHYVEQLAISQGVRVMRTDTTENSEGIPWKSYPFWRKMGYKDTGERLATQWSFKEIPFTKNLNHTKTKT